MSASNCARMSACSLRLESSDLRWVCASFDTRMLTTRFARGGNVLGFPALSIPCGSSSEGLPIGLQLMARPFEEDLLLTLGEGLECS